MLSFLPLLRVVSSPVVASVTPLHSITASEEGSGGVVLFLFFFRLFRLVVGVSWGRLVTGVAVLWGRLAVGGLLVFSCVGVLVGRTLCGVTGVVGMLCGRRVTGGLVWGLRGNWNASEGKRGESGKTGVKYPQIWQTI
eukprot:sb/3474471/